MPTMNSARVETPDGSFAKNLSVQTGEAYAIDLVAKNNISLQGSLKVLTEDSVNGAGTRRLLLKVELPLVPPTQPGQNSGCGCCEPAAAEEVPAVSAHVVITVPKSIAQGVTKSDAVAQTQVGAAIRLLQATLGSVCHKTLNWDTTSEGEVIAENLVMTVDGSGEDNQGDLRFPIRYDEEIGKMRLDVGILPDAPIWGLLGGLRSLS
jgi:hypothetical protein